jgi:Flp pilus assembly pilin Flp
MTDKLLKTYLKAMLYLEDDEGADLAEYALILALVAIAAVASLRYLGGRISYYLRYVGSNM